MAPSEQRRHHVFLFRHCMRSTELDVNLFHQGGSKQNASDFTASPLPTWDVPAMWCTKGGMKIMMNTGKFLMNFLTSDDSVGSLKVQFISDAVKRDVDTSFAISQGMAAAAPTGVRVDGLSDLIYSRQLFSPLNSSGYYPDQREQGPLCQAKYSRERVRRDITARLKLIPPPKPGLLATLARFDALGGSGVAGPLASIPPSDFTLVDNDKNVTKLEGAVNVAHVFAQMMFYSRASDIHPPFLPNATLEEVYQMLSWVHWQRAILDTGNAKSSTEGAVLARALVESLEHGAYDVRTDIDPLDYDSTATFIIGHDGDLDKLGSSLGVKWKLKKPYNHVGDFSPTPPGSGIHAVFDEATGNVGLSFLYPVPLKGHGTKWKLHQDGNLTSVPLEFDPPFDQEGAAVSSDGFQTLVTSVSDRASGLDALRTRVFSVLQKSPGALECYNQLQIPRPSTESSPLFLFAPWDIRMTEIVVGVASLFLACSALLLCRRRRGSSKRSARESQEEYDEVNREIEVL